MSSSAPITSTCLARPDAIHACAVAKPYTKPEQAAETSIAAARVLPMASLTSAAVDGIQ